MKKELRKKFLDIRKNINNKEEKDNIIYETVINDEKVKQAQTILIYVSINSEVDTINLINYFLKNKKVAVPKIENNVMNFYYINSLNDLAKGYMDILEPITTNKVKSFKNCICLVPGICFNIQGYRIGYGKGFYDRFLRKNNIYAIGLCYKECLINDLFQESHDYKINKIIKA